MPVIGRVCVGTAGWSIPRAAARHVTTVGSHLHRYATRLGCVEINSSFYRPHRQSTYRRWRDATPPAFRFAIKMPRTITHELRLRDAGDPLRAFLEQTDGLGDKRGPILVQLPPSFEFDDVVVTSFLDQLRTAFSGQVVCEPRHPSWFTAAVHAMFERYSIARVAADPPPAPGAGWPGGSTRLAYFRMHGSPRMYWSSYDSTAIAALVTAVTSQRQADESWCVFDNTAAGAAFENAIQLADRLGQDEGASPDSRSAP